MPSHFEVISQLVADKEALQEEVRRLRQLVAACERYTRLLREERQFPTKPATDDIFAAMGLSKR